MSNCDFESQLDLMKEALKIIHEADLLLPPPVIAGKIYAMLQKKTGVSDLYISYKKNSTEVALSFYSRLKRAVAESVDPLNTAIRISALGNLLDAANPEDFDLEQEIQKIEHYQILGGGLENFKSRLEKASGLLMLGDNAGETVFDRVFIEEIDLPVTYVVRDGPAYNDANYQDALDAGLDKCSKIISNGSKVPGTHLPSCSPGFRELFQSADLILAKGQGNYETLSDQKGNVYYLMKIKCGSVAQDINIPVGSIVLKEGNHLKDA